jgi:hypothetical protein
MLYIIILYLEILWSLLNELVNYLSLGGGSIDLSFNPATAVLRYMEIQIILYHLDAFVKTVTIE